MIIVFSKSDVIGNLGVIIVFSKSDVIGNLGVTILFSKSDVIGSLGVTILFSKSNVIGNLGVTAYVTLLDKLIRARNDLLLNISLAGGQSLKWINHERKVCIYFDSNTQKIKNMNKSFRVYNDSAILNKMSEFPVTLVWTETRISTYFLNVH